MAQLQRDLPVHYERIETFQNGKSLGVKEKGSPYLYNHEFDMPMLAGDGGVYPWGRAIAVDITRACASGGHECISRVILAPGEAARPGVDAGVFARRQEKAKATVELRTAEEIQADVMGVARYDVVVTLRESETWKIPPVWAVGPINALHGRPDYAGELRKEILAKRAESRSLRGESFVRWLEAHGGEVDARLFGVLNEVRCRVDAKTLTLVVEHPDVQEVKRERFGRKGRADGPDLYYLCRGGERYDPVRQEDDEWLGVDEEDSACDGDVAGYLDARLAAINAYAYLDAGYAGAGGGAAIALAGSWATMTVDGEDVHHMTLAIVETEADLMLDHPAFLTAANGESRFRWSTATVSTSDEPENEADHPTNLAGIALGNITDGQDTWVTDDVQRDARSGVARRALAGFSDIPFDEFLSGGGGRRSAPHRRRAPG